MGSTILFACCYATTLKRELETEGGLKPGGVPCLRSQYEYNKVKIIFRVAKFWMEIQLTSRTIA